jgi:hypothetical protein
MARRLRSPIAPRRRYAAAPAAWAIALAAGGCGDTRTSSSFEQRAADAGGPLELQATWRYRSPEVDVDIELVTVEGSNGCTTSARLRVDEALAGNEVYRLQPTDCADLRLADDGDLVLLSSPTGHDWAAEAIDVDTERELIRLGPWHDEAHGITYRFALGSPPCADDTTCECPRLERRAGEQLTSLELARSCD